MKTNPGLASRLAFPKSVHKPDIHITLASLDETPLSRCPQGSGSEVQRIGRSLEDCAEAGPVVTIVIACPFPAESRGDRSRRGEPTTPGTKRPFF